MVETQLLKDCWRALDEELDCGIARFTERCEPAFGKMIRYQLGWNGNGFDPARTGKRIRPLLLLFVTHALEGEWRKALPAAAAVELVHNFSLVHDDIQDKSETRRGSDTVWVKWGIAQAINTGDAMLTLANLEMALLEDSQEPSIVMAAVRSLNKATFDLTVGQYLDLAHEKAEDVTMADYFEMVKGKTGALFAVCFRLGALIAGKKPTELIKYSDLGEKFGLAFQIQDDYLGIWGQHGFTGKTVTGDLLNRKKTFPVHYALENLPKARDYWVKHETFTVKDLEWFKNCLENGAVDKITLAEIGRIYADSTAQLSFLFQGSKSASELFQLLNSLFERNR